MKTELTLTFIPGKLTEQELMLLTEALKSRKIRVNKSIVKGLYEELGKRDKRSKVSFNEFWEAYQKKVSEPKSKILWNALPSKQQKKAMSYLPGYIKAEPNKKFRLDPERYINRRKWNDELIVDEEQDQEKKEKKDQTYITNDW